MRRIECAKAGRTEEAVALCTSCSAGLCLKHLRETAAHLAGATTWARCAHDTLSGAAGAATRGVS